MLNQPDEVGAPSIPVLQDGLPLLIANKPSTTIDCINPAESYTGTGLGHGSTPLITSGHDNVITQEPQLNNLDLNDAMVLEKKQIDGLAEKNLPAEDFHDYRHSLDHVYFLWCSGQDNLTVVDKEDFEAVEVIK